jgi:Flp pilus assembly pilin Flp
MAQTTGSLATCWRRAVRMASDAQAATAVEYALMASGISLAIMSVVWTLGDKLKESFYDKLAAMF